MFFDPLEVTITGAIHPSKLLKSTEVEHDMLCSCFMSLSHALASFAVECVPCFTWAPDNILPIFVQHSTVRVLCASSFGTFERRCAILLEQWDLLGAFKVPTFTLINLDNILFHRWGPWALLINSHDPELVVPVVHLSRTQIPKAFLTVTYGAIFGVASPLE